MFRYIIFFFVGLLASNAQQVFPPENIKSVVFSSENSGNDGQFPIFRLGDSAVLEFDDLNATESDYYYTITHCDYNWEASSLIKSEYMSGLDFQKIPFIENSNTTIQPYSHYKLSIPNEDVSLNISGNYLLSVFDENEHLIFTRRFVVYTDKVGVSVWVKRPKNVKYFDTHQQLYFKIKDKNQILENPETSVKVAVIQNFNWNSLREGITPSYIFSDEMVYGANDDEQLLFEAGNEYFYFENKDIRTASDGVYQVVQQEFYHAHLYPNMPRNHSTYTYQPDINGNFVLTIPQGASPNESDYAWVHFYLESSPEYVDKQIYVYGKFSDNQLKDAYQLTFDPEKKLYHGKVFLKQGFYNYKFAVNSENTNNYNAISGNFYQTENRYVVLVYYKNTSQTYDQVIGVGSLRSEQIEGI